MHVWDLIAHVWDFISTDLSKNQDIDVFRLSDGLFSDLGTRCRTSTLFKDALEKQLMSAGIKPFSFCLKLDGRWEMSEYSILLKIIASLQVIVRLNDPDDPSKRLYSDIRAIASVFVSCAIREINVTSLMEPSEQHTLNPVLLYRMVEDCISEYSGIVRGTVPEVITQLFDKLEYRKEQIYDNQGKIIRGQFEESIWGFDVDGRSIPLIDSDVLPTEAINNESKLKTFVFNQLKKCAKILLIKLRGGDNRNEPGEIFSNWEYVKLAASCMDNRKFDVPPSDFSLLPHSDQENMKFAAWNKKFADFKALIEQRLDIIERTKGIKFSDADLMEAWKKFVCHVYMEYSDVDIRKLDYYEFWRQAHRDAVLQAECSVVLSLNSIINTECGSNATAEHLGHMSNLVTQKQRERLKPLRASNEIIASYMMPTLPDVIRLKLHQRLSALWRKIGGRVPTGARGTIRFKKSRILNQTLKRPTPKHGRKTKYFKKALHEYDANLKKVQFLVEILLQ